jgi:hypothetical protein
MKFLGNVDTPKAVVGVSNVGAVSTNQTADFAVKSAYTYTVGDNVAFTISNLTAGQRGSLSLLCNATPRTPTFVGIGTWVGGAMPAMVANKLTVVSLFHDGVRVIASYGVEA